MIYLIVIPLFGRLAYIAFQRRILNATLCLSKADDGYLAIFKYSILADLLSRGGPTFNVDLSVSKTQEELMLKGVIAKHE